MELKLITSYLDQYLDMNEFRDDSANGLQVENSENVDKIGLAVDACQEAINKAIDENCKLLIVHHGLFWGRQELIIDNHFQRVRAMVIADMALYAAHLPLDAHHEVGHNIQIAKKIGLTNIEPFAIYHGRAIGIKGKLPVSRPCSDFFQDIEKIIGSCRGVLEFGPRTIHTVGIVAGSASDPELLKELKIQGIDLFVSGEAKHGVYHIAQELGLNIFYGGHYQTETFGMKALAEHLQEQMDLETVFIDTPCFL